MVLLEWDEAFDVRVRPRDSSRTDLAPADGVHFADGVGAGADPDHDGWQNLDTGRGYAFTSQLYFDEAISDRVYARSPYAGSAPRTRNDADFIYRHGGKQLTLALVPASAVMAVVLHHTSFGIGLLGVLVIVFGVAGGLLGLLISLAWFALKVALVVGLVYWLLTVFSPETARKMRDVLRGGSV